MEQTEYPEDCFKITISRKGRGSKTCRIMDDFFEDGNDEMLGKIIRRECYDIAKVCMDRGRYMVGEMKPGRELDALVAEKVFGRRIVTQPGIGGFTKSHKTMEVDVICYGVKCGTIDFKEIPAYSTDISAAWEVVECLRSKGFEVTIRHEVRMTRVVVRSTVDGTYQNPAAFALQETAPCAICLAALKSIGVEVSE